MVKILEPEYFGKFACLAGDCKYTCCHGWSIFIRRAEYHKLRGQRLKPEMKRIADACIKRNKNNPTDMSYGIMLLNDKYNCQFLSETGLCRLQIECGASALPTICKTFPRLLSQAPGGYQRCCTTGCEQTVHLLLQAKNGLRFVEREQTVEGGVSLTKTLSADALATPQGKFFTEIQALCIAILQNRAYTLEDRMILLGLALQDFDEAVAAGDEAVQDWLRRRRAFATPESAEVMQESLSTLPKNRDMSVMNSLLLAINIQNNSQDSVYSTLLKQAFGAIEARLTYVQESEESILVYNSEQYEAAVQGSAELLHELEYLMENVLVNFFFEQRAPLISTSMWDFYLSFCTSYSFFRVLAVAYLAACPGQESYIHVLTCCSRRLFHSAQTVQKVVAHLHETSTDTLAHMAMLVKG